MTDTRNQQNSSFYFLDGFYTDSLYIILLKSTRTVRKSTWSTRDAGKEGGCSVGGDGGRLGHRGPVEQEPAISCSVLIFRVIYTSIN